ncbi:MAG: ferredoxin [Candidatus Pacearchaeota archaeon]|jgi:ferredoxin
MVKVDKKKCIGCGTCPGICPDVFEMSEDGKAQVKKNADKKAKCIKKAIESCPVNAISN